MTHEMTYDDAFRPDLEPEYDGGGQPANPLLLIHNCLRGRYVLAALLGLVLAFPLAWVGYNAIPPKYTSTGVINIQPTRPIVLYENEFTEGMSGFASFVNSQATVLRSQRVLSAAIENERLKNSGWAPLPRGLKDLSEAVSVVVPRNAQDIFVSVEWTDPRLAQAATNAILDVYSEIAVEREATDLQTTIDTVSDLREEARVDRDDYRTRAYQLAEKEGTDNLVRLLDAKHEQIRYIDATLLEIDLQLPPESGGAVTPQPDGQTAEGQAPAQPQSTDAELEALAASNRELATLLARRVDLQLRIESLSQRFGPAHRQIVAAEDELKSVNVLIEAKAAMARASTPGGAVTADPVAQLRSQRNQLRQRLDNVLKEAQRIGRVQLQIDQLREQADRADEKFREADLRLESLLVQKRDGQQGRINISQRADTPLGPSTDRRIPLAAMGFMGGGGIGVGLVVLLGLLKPKYRYISEIDRLSQSVRIIGAVPQIDMADPAVNIDELMATSVHQIRTAIDARLLGTSSRGLAHLVTSSSSGEGKSTISLRLARSFAISGKRTLLIDADMIGRRISSKFGLDSRPGFGDAVLGDREAPLPVHPGDQDNLVVMPAGPREAFAPERISASAVDSLFERLRREFDVLVIDTGPILGSIEAQAIVPASDEVLLVVSRGRDVRHVRMAIERLQRLGARRLGIVFNRAANSDFERSTSMSLASERFSQPTSARAEVLHDSANGHTSNRAG
ncbi:MAG: polysaccharide biosynthesis tyrosine autokinase [Phycisphaerales bacterium JB041]